MPGTARTAPPARQAPPPRGRFGRKKGRQGKRFRFLIHKPARMDLWDEYVAMRVENQIAGDEHGRRRTSSTSITAQEMDAGAEVANPNRFNPDKLPDRSQVEVSALQRYFNEVGQRGAGGRLDRIRQRSAGRVRTAGKRPDGLPRATPGLAGSRGRSSRQAARF